MTRILHRQIKGELPVAASGHGVYIRDTEGRDYIDASGGAAVSCLGHDHADVKAAIREQLDKLPYAHTSFFTTQVAEELADKLIADALEAKIKELGAESVIAFVAETVVGATAGAVAPAPGYFKRIREICDRNGILLILDEVMSGMGRTGTLHACEQEGISPDLMTIAKGLGAGYQPIGANISRRPRLPPVESAPSVLP